LDEPVEVPSSQGQSEEQPKPARSSGTLTPPDMIIPLQGERIKKTSEQAASEIVAESSPVNEDGNVSSEPELAADSSGEDGQGDLSICVSINL